MMMSVKEYMNSIREQEMRIQAKQDYIERMKKIIPADAKKSIPDIYARLVEAKKETVQMCRAFFQSKQEAIRLLDEINPENAMILVKRYWEKKTMREIGSILYLSERQVYRRLDSAEAEFQSVLDVRENRKAG